MDVDRHVELFGPGEDRPEFRHVVELAVGLAMHHGALEAEILYAAFELVGGGFRLAHRQAGESSEPVGTRLDDAVQPVVDSFRPLPGLSLVEGLGAGRAVRQHLDIDAGLVHLPDAQIVHVDQPLARILAAAGALVDLGVDIGVEIMLLDGNDLRSVPARHDESVLPVNCCSVRAARAGHSTVHMA